MTTIMSRRVASTPVRTAAQTWEKIVELLAPDPGCAARKELGAAAGIACSSISSEATKDAPIVVWGSGPRVRVYCAFDEDAITNDGVNEEALPKSPLKGDWQMSIPCLRDDLAWSREKLAAVSSRITARCVDDDVPKDKAAPENVAPNIEINLAEFLKS